MYVDFYKEQIAADIYSDRELSALINNNNLLREYVESVSYTHLTLPTKGLV